MKHENAGKPWIRQSFFRQYFKIIISPNFFTAKVLFYTVPNNISNVHSYKIKYTERISEFKRSYSDEDKKKWEKVLTPELAISSDESGTEDGKGVIFCEKIPW